MGDVTMEDPNSKKTEKWVVLPQPSWLFAYQKRCVWLPTHVQKTVFNAHKCNTVAKICLAKQI